MKHLKGILFAAWLIITALISIFAWVFTDYAKVKFWWVAWEVVGIVTPFIFALSIIWYTKNKKKW